MAIFYKYCKERHSELWIDIINHISWWILNTWILLKIVVLKSVFSEIRVMTGVWVVSCQRTGFWLANLSGLPIKGLFSGQKTTWTHVLTRIFEKLTLHFMPSPNMFSSTYIKDFKTYKYIWSIFTTLNFFFVSK